MQPVFQIDLTGWDTKFYFDPFFFSGIVKIGRAEVRRGKIQTFLVAFLFSRYGNCIGKVAQQKEIKEVC